MNSHIAGGGSELELKDPLTGRSRVLPDPDGRVIAGAVLSEDGSTVAISLESPIRPREIWSLAVESMIWHRVSVVPALPSRRLVRPTMEFFYASDGYPLTGLLYRPIDQRAAGPALISLPDHPDALERPTFKADYQALVATGVTVFAPRIRGGSGLERSIADSVAARNFLLQLSYADPDRIALAGRGEGSSVARAALVAHPELFVGVLIEGETEAHQPDVRPRLI